MTLRDRVVITTTHESPRHSTCGPYFNRAAAMHSASTRLSVVIRKTRLTLELCSTSAICQLRAGKLMRSETRTEQRKLKSSDAQPMINNAGGTALSPSAVAGVG
jgi:hypothetical protein